MMNLKLRGKRMSVQTKTNSTAIATERDHGLHRNASLGQILHSPLPRTLRLSHARPQSQCTNVIKRPKKTLKIDSEPIQKQHSEGFRVSLSIQMQDSLKSRQTQIDSNRIKQQASTIEEYMTIPKEFVLRSVMTQAQTQMPSSQVQSTPQISQLFKQVDRKSIIRNCETAKASKQRRKIIMKGNRMKNPIMFFEKNKESKLFSTLAGVELEKDLQLQLFKNQYYANNWTMKKDQAFETDETVDEEMREQLKQDRRYILQQVIKDKYKPHLAMAAEKYGSRSVKHLEHLKGAIPTDILHPYRVLTDPDEVLQSKGESEYFLPLSGYKKPEVKADSQFQEFLEYYEKKKSRQITTIMSDEVTCHTQKALADLERANKRLNAVCSRVK